MGDEQSRKNDRQEPAETGAPLTILSAPVRILIATGSIGAIVAGAIAFLATPCSG